VAHTRSQELEPKGNFVGTDSQVALSYCPIVQLDEYINIWGSRRCHVISNYMHYDALEGSEPNPKDTTYNAFRKAAMDDLLYLVEIMAYLPFTRTGRITIRPSDIVAHYLIHPVFVRMCAVRVRTPKIILCHILFYLKIYP